MRRGIMNRVVIFITVLLVSTDVSFSQAPFEKDRHSASGGNVEMTFLGHGSVMLEQAGKIVYVDPVSRYADFTQFPKADLILVTHDHGDHLDSLAIARLRNETTAILLTEACLPLIPGGEVIRNGESKVVKGVRVEAVPAYNLVHMRSPGRPYHPKGAGNGYIIGIGGLRIYFAGDTENIPEMSNLGTIDHAFLPMNLPYTMTPEMVAEAVKRIKPKVFYPYHFGNTDTDKIVNLLAGERGTEVRVRKMK